MTSNAPSIGSDSSGLREADLALVEAVASGCLHSWHGFLNRYSGLIHSVLRRHLFAEDEDDIRTVFVDVLETLYRGGLSKYRGESRLSTWLVVFTRNRALDKLRERRGRRRHPKGYELFDELTREVFRLYFVERLPLPVTVHELRWRGVSGADADGIVASIQRLEETLDRRYLESLEDECHARLSGVDSMRMLRYLINLRCEFEGRTAGDRPDALLVEEESAEIAEKVKQELSYLAADERKVVFLRYARGWSARRIAERLGLKNQRKAYLVIEKAVRKLRESLADEE